MCDTMVALADSTADSCVLFAKNSDRQRNEAQIVERVAGADHANGAVTDCTYIAIPQVAHTHTVLLCRPYWIWGAEMGANEHGVVIGNEAVRARVPASEGAALTGMDLVRLVLERASSSAEAVDVLTALLERHGQGGDCGHMVPLYYNNSFLIADSKDAFVVETVGREWAIERVRSARAISNCYSIGTAPEQLSAGMEPLLRGWAERGDKSIPVGDILGARDRDAAARSRLARAEELMGPRRGRLRMEDLVSILRDHGSEATADYNPREETSGPAICMHAARDERAWQTTNSLVAEIRQQACVYWVTGTAAPCLSIFKPIFLDVAELPSAALNPGACWDSQSLWWRHESLHRGVLGGDFAAHLQEICNERDALEAEFRRRVSAVNQERTVTERASVARECWDDASKLEERWSCRLNRGEARTRPTGYEAAWLKMNRVAGLPPR